VYLSFFHEEWYRPENSAYRKHLPLLHEATRDKLIEIMAMMKRHLQRISHDTAGELVYYFLEDSGYLKIIANYKTEAEEKKALNIVKFLNLLKTFENNKADSTVFAVVEYIQMSMDLGESPISADTDVALANAVNILTVHAAKGLEFPVVFLPNLVNARFPSTDRREMIPIPDALIKELLPQGDYHLQEERRLFYVALTRAKERIYLTASNIYGDGKRKKKVSLFVAETVGEDIINQKKAQGETKENQLSIFDFKVKNLFDLSC
jgi:DNA helicase-2/ATP-dependent DNA helicase PcrA